MALPPPNVTGSLHIGHALDHTYQDYLARLHRMRGFEVLWLPGMDHAGIATQNVVERELAKEGKTRFDLGREAFVERVWAWKAESGGRILGQMQRLGDSVDWSRERFTMDEGLSRAVREVFVSLYEQGLLYRGRRIINWCPRCLTALSDIEVEHEEVPGELAHLRYPLADGSGSIGVATSRAETMLGDTAVAVHPDDPRYQDLIGRTVRLPLVDRLIPIVADAAVDREFGTGAVKVTPAHDPNDYEIAERHGLPGGRHPHRGGDRQRRGRPVRGPGPLRRPPRGQGRPGRAGPAGAGRARRRTRSATATAAGPRSSRGCRCSGSWPPGRWPTRPWRRSAPGRPGSSRSATRRPSSAGWSRSATGACPASSGGATASPPGTARTGTSPWPARTRPPAPSAAPASWPRTRTCSTPGSRAGCGRSRPSAGPAETEDLAAFYPTSVLVTGYDIIFFWVARMLMFGCHFQPPTPFEVVAIHGMVRDAQGKKMSKSFGNVIDPIELMDRYGTDALRFALIRGANPGSDVPMAEEWVEGARNFANKLWNLGRFVLSIEGAESAPPNPPEPSPSLALADRWLLSQLERTRAAVTAAYDGFDPAEAARLLHGFAWSELADWAVELAKPRLGAGGEDAQRAGATLAYALEVTLRLLHPVMPFVTEELARALTGVETLTLGPWPAERPGDVDPEAEAGMADLQEAIVALRRFRAEHRVPTASRPRLVVVAADQAQADLFRAEADSLRRLARLEDVEVATAAPTAPNAKLLAGRAELYLPLEGLLDLDEERARLDRELAALDVERTRAEAKLANPAFLEKAPAPVVAKARERLAEVDQALAKVRAQQVELSGAR